MVSYFVYFPAWSVPGVTTWCVPVHIIGDSIVEDTEVLIIQLVSADPVVYIDVNSATTMITIYEDLQDCK